ncbi:MAG: PASTA domain-containing protein [Alistipes sp.]|nr:PASTA domain-containing protein [Alistipes sp.]
MEQRNRRPRRKPQSSGLKGTIERLKQSPVAYNAVLIVIVLIAILVVSNLLMVVITRHGTHRAVPDFSGLKLAQVEAIADKQGFEIIINDSLFVPAYEGGIVLDQLPKSGAEVKAGRKVYVTINSFRQKMVKVPYVAGRSLRQAKNMLEVAGLGIEKLVYEEDIATNYVLAQIVEGKEMTDRSDVELEMGSGVVLKVGVEEDNNSTIVPKAIGQSLQSAKSRLWEQGLNVGNIHFDEGINLLNQKDARVYRQSISHNATATLGTVVDLWLTLDDAAVDKSSAASDKQARELEEERLKAEQELRDSLEQAEVAERNVLMQALQESSQRNETITETDEDEFF